MRAAAFRRLLYPWFYVRLPPTAMPLGNAKPWPFPTPALPGLVLNDTDFRSKGYVWGHDGKVWYCFLDPERYRFEVWKKEFVKWKLATILANLVAALGALAVQQYWLALWLFAALPTLPFALLSHYRDTARAQPAAVVTNGPQMRYPFNLTTGGITTAIASGTLVSFLAAGFASYKAGLTIFGVTLAGAGLATFAGTVALGSAVNAGALLLFIAGQLAKPFNQVVANGVVIDPGLTYGGWYHFGRTQNQLLGDYRVGLNDPLGLAWAAGGLNPIVINGGRQNSPGLEIVVWGLLPLRPDGRPLRDPPPPGTSLDDYAATPDGRPTWTEPTNWQRGLIVVAGCNNWGIGETNALISHGVVHAVATDGHLSPLLGSSGQLVMETYFPLDPIQWYGFKAVPQ